MLHKATVLLVSALGLSLLLSACAPPPPTPTSAPAVPGGAAPAKQATASTGDAAKGKDLYAQTCAGCHGPDAKGLPSLGKDLTTSTFAKGLSNPQFVDFIKKGRPASDPLNTTKVDMPPKGGNPALTDPQIADIVAYVRTLEK